MNTHEHNEQLRRAETLLPSTEIEAAQGASTSFARASEMLETRKHMLASIESDIELVLFGMLSDKIEHEYASLVAMMESEHKAVEQKRKMDRVLKSEYFTRKRLDLDL